MTSRHVDNTTRRHTGISSSRRVGVCECRCDDSSSYGLVALSVRRRANLSIRRRVGERSCRVEGVSWCRHINTSIRQRGRIVSDDLATPVRAQGDTGARQCRPQISAALGPATLKGREVAGDPARGLAAPRRALADGFEPATLGRHAQQHICHMETDTSRIPRYHTPGATSPSPRLRESARVVTCGEFV